jgi:hypothetical protein
VIHKSCFKKVGVFNTAFIRGEDMDLWARLAREYTIIKSRRITATYRIDAENKSDVKTVPVQKTYLRNVPLDKQNNPDEFAFYKHHLITKLKHYLVKKEWKNFFYIVRKYNFNLLK